MKQIIENVNLQNIRDGFQIPYNIITIEQAEEIYKEGYEVICNGDGLVMELKKIKVRI